MYKARNLINTPQVTNDHWKAPTSSRNASNVSSVSIEQFFVSRDNNSSSSYSLFLPTGTFLVVHRSVSLILPFALSGRGCFFAGFFCEMNALIPSFSVSTTLSFQILFLHILGYSGFEMKNVQITRSAKCLYVSVGRPNLMALPCAVPQYL